MQRFKADTGLSCGANCKELHVLPSPLAIERALPKTSVKPVCCQVEMHRSNLPPHHSDSRMLPVSAFIGMGGNGVVFKQVLNGKKFAIKWVW